VSFDQDRSATPNADRPIGYPASMTTSAIRGRSEPVVAAPPSSNREIGLIWMADILGRLYESWPRKITLELHDTIEATDVQPCGIEDAASELWFDLGSWLEAEGIIRAGEGVLGDIAIDDAVLTARGFQLLGKPQPGETQGEKSIGAQLRELAKETVGAGAKDAAKKTASDLVGSFLGSFVKSFTS
jgi:hypothetical protein